MEVGQDMSPEQPDQSMTPPDMSQADMSPDLAPDMEPGTPDMPVTQDMGDAPGCEELELPASLSLGVGQGIWLEVSESHEILEVSGEDVVSWVDESGRVRVRAKYEVVAQGEVMVKVSCLEDGSVQVHTMSLDVEALEVDYVENWGDQNGPVRREHAPFLFHPDDPDALYMYGGFAYRPRQFTVITDFWRFDRTTRTWTEVMVAGTPPAAATGRFVYSPARKAFLTVGGNDILQNTVNTNLYSLSREPMTGEWSWSTRSIQGELEHSLGALVYDEQADRLVALLGFGGIGQTGYTFFEGAASVDLGAEILRWDEIAPVMPAPTPRYGFAYFVDPVTERLVVTGGAQGLRVVDPATDSWAYDWRQNVWEELSEVNVGGIFQVPGRHSGGRNPCWAFDPVHRRMFVWGGTPDGRTTDPGLYALHLDEPGASRWYEVSRDGFPATRASCSGGYNPATGELYFGFGNGDDGVHQDLIFVKAHAL